VKLRLPSYFATILRVLFPSSANHSIPMLVLVSLFSLLAPTDAEAQAAESAADSATEQKPLWPNDPPAWAGTQEQEHDTSGPDGGKVAGKSVIRLGHVSTPQLHLYPASADADHAKTMVLICPGGGYSILAWDLEGTEIASQFNALGFSAAVLKYRVPTRQMEQAWLPPVQDVQRAISLLRSQPTASGGTFDRVGLVGFSAGGNAASRASAAGGKRFYEPIDKADEASCQPDFAGLIYPWLMIESPAKAKPGQSNAGILPELKIDSSTPPMFLAHAIDDPISCKNSVDLFSRLHEQGIPAELHVYAGGGHGFGARDKNVAAANWPEQMAKWLIAIESK
jgi:acetyl esterase/lipase